MIKHMSTIAALSLAATLAAGQSASVTVSSSAATVAPGGSFTVTLETTFDTGGASGGVFGAAGFYGFGGSVQASGAAASSLSAGVPTLNNMLAFGPVAAGGMGVDLATGAAGRGLAGGIAGDPGDLMTLTVTVAPSATPGDVTLDFDGAVVLVQGDALVTYSTNPGPNQQSLATNTVTVMIGAGGCNAADVAMPFGLLDLADINAFVAGFLGMTDVGDIDDNGLFDLNDINQFVSAFTAGCP